MNTQPFRRILHPGSKKTQGGRIYNVFCSIEWDGRVLSISGVEGPLQSGNCLGSCGQIMYQLFDLHKLTPGWDSSILNRFIAIWQRWHLNDMQSACEHQREQGQSWEKDGPVICPKCGYKLGSEWLYEEVPDDILDYLQSLPESSLKPAWI